MASAGPSSLARWVRSGFDWADADRRRSSQGSALSLAFELYAQLRRHRLDNAVSFNWQRNPTRWKLGKPMGFFGPTKAERDQDDHNRGQEDGAKAGFLEQVGQSVLG